MIILLLSTAPVFVEEALDENAFAQEQAACAAEEAANAAY